jgi:Tfp pilus assembly protein PilV
MKRAHTTDKPNAVQGLEKIRTRAGTTMLEALIAMTIFAIFTTGACKLLVSHRTMLDMARDHYTAANIAKNRMELLRTFNFEQIPALNEKAIRTDENGIPSALGHFSRSTTVSTLNTNIYELAITVKVQNRRTLAFDVAEQTLNTYIAKRL